MTNPSRPLWASSIWTKFEKINTPNKQTFTCLWESYFPKRYFIPAYNQESTCVQVYWKPENKIGTQTLFCCMKLLYQKFHFVFW